MSTTADLMAALKKELKAAKIIIRLISHIKFDELWIQKINTTNQSLVDI